MEEINVFTLENGEEYNEVKRIVYNDDTYVLLSNVLNDSDICIRKLKKENNEEFMYRLDKDEFDTILKIFAEENN